MLEENGIPKVELEEMNAMHYEEVTLLVELLRRLDAVTNGDLSPETLDASLATLIEHMRAHFTAEERQMLGAEFPAYPAHKAEHDRVLAEGRAIFDRWVRDRDERALRTYLETALPAWMIHHITTMDADAARFLASRGRDCVGATGKAASA